MKSPKSLSEDPTLTDELRAVYVNHLMAFALALDDVEQSDLLATAARGQPDLERVVLEQMSAALLEGKADRVYKRLARWMSNPLGFKGMFWIELLHRAALGYGDMLAKAGNPERLNAFLHHVRTTRPELQVQHVLPALVETALPLAAKHQPLALTVFAIAADSLPPDHWQRFITRQELSILPRNLARLLRFINGTETETPPSGLLAKVAMGVRHGMAAAVDHSAVGSGCDDRALRRGG